MRRAVNKKSQRKRAKPTHRRDGWSIAPAKMSADTRRAIEFAENSFGIPGEACPFVGGRQYRPPMEADKGPRVADELQFDPWYPKPGELAAARKYHGLSQFKAAEAMDIPLMRLSMLEAGLAKVTEDEGFAIFWLYGVHNPQGAIID